MPDSRDRFDDPDAPPSEEEVAQADELRADLEDPRRESELAELARTVSAAWEPRDLSEEEHRALVEQAVSRPRARARGARVIRISFGAAAMVALAASVLLVLRGGQPGPHDGPVPLPLAISRSTQELFDEQFAPTGGETGRIDRIAMARATDLRDNEFARWGVR
jgi:hypothetical protein